MEWKKQMTRVGKALLASVLLTAILLFVMALILYKANLSGLAEHVMVILIYLLACLAGGFLLGKQEEKRRFLWGAGFGALYFFLLLLLANWFVGRSLLSAKQFQDRLRIGQAIELSHKRNRTSAFSLGMVIPVIASHGDTSVAGKTLFTSGREQFFALPE